MDDNSIKSKSIIYGGNFVAGAIGKVFDYNLANPYAAIAYGTLDVLGEVSDKFRNSVFPKLANTGGAMFFGVSAINDLVSILNQDYSALAQLPFDASMALQLSANTSELFGENNEGIVEGLRKFGKNSGNIVKES